MKLLIASQQSSLSQWFENVLDDSDNAILVEGDDVVNAFSKDRYDAVVLDIAHGGIDPQDLIPQLRKIARRRWLPIAIYCDEFQETMLSGAFHAGADDIIQASYPSWLLRNKLSALSRVEKIQNELQAAMDRLEQLSLVDTVTQLPNYRGVMREGVRLFGQANREEKPFAAVMIEIDHFQHYIEEHGHQQSVELFKTLALLVEGSSSRPLDFVGRYDDETLLLLLPETDTEGSQKVANAILKHVREASLPFATSPDENIVTVSVATNSYDPNESPISVEALLGTLKNVLEQAQDSGHDRAIAV